MARQLTDTDVDADPAAPTPPALQPPPPPASVNARLRSSAGLWARRWAAPLWAHAAALAVVLIALVPVVGTGASFSADEGAAIVQARHLSRGDGWIVDHPLPQADPTGKAYPLELSAHGPNGTAPFAKHPLYALMLAGADRLGGVTGMVLLSLAGTLIAAVLAATLGGRLAPGLARPSLWAVGLASPLLFDGYLVIAHTLGAAFAAGAVVMALRGIEGDTEGDGEGRGWGRGAPAVVGVAGCVAAAVLLRTEAQFWGLALGVVLAAVAVRRRDKLCAVLAVTSAAAAGAARVFEQAWISRILGGVGAPALGSSLQPGGGSGLFSDRFDGLTLTWLRPSYGGVPRLDLLLVVMLAAVVAGALAVRRRADDKGVVVLLGTVAAAAAVGALVVDPTNVVPGLLVACPLVTAGLVVLRRTTLVSVVAQVCLGAFVVFALAVAATQYATGGSGEWGGRYFALGLPMLLPVVLLALAQLGDRLGRATRQAGLAALVVCCVAMTTMSLSSLRAAHRLTADLMVSADQAGLATGDPRPVMVATRGLIPRMAWGTFDHQRWLLADPEDLGGLVGRVAATGVNQVVLVSDDLGHDLDRIGPTAHVVSRQGRPDGHNWQVVRLRLGS